MKSTCQVKNIILLHPAYNRHIHVGTELAFCKTGSKWVQGNILMIPMWHHNPRETTVRCSHWFQNIRRKYVSHKAQTWTEGNKQHWPKLSPPNNCVHPQPLKSMDLPTANHPWYSRSSDLVQEQNPSDPHSSVNRQALVLKIACGTWSFRLQLPVRSITNTSHALPTYIQCLSVPDGHTSSSNHCSKPQWNS